MEFLREIKLDTAKWGTREAVGALKCPAVSIKCVSWTVKMI